MAVVIFFDSLQQDLIEYVSEFLEQHFRNCINSNRGIKNCFTIAQFPVCLGFSVRIFFLIDLRNMLFKTFQKFVYNIPAHPRARVYIEEANNIYFACLACIQLLNSHILPVCQMTRHFAHLHKSYARQIFSHAFFTFIIANAAIFLCIFFFLFSPST